MIYVTLCNDPIQKKHDCLLHSPTILVTRSSKNKNINVITMGLGYIYSAWTCRKILFKIHNSHVRKRLNLQTLEKLQCKMNE